MRLLLLTLIGFAAAQEDHTMHGGAMPHSHGIDDFDDLHGDGHAYHDSVPHHGHPSVRLHSLWLTPVLDVNMASLVSEEEFQALAHLAVALFEAYQASGSKDSFRDWQLAEEPLAAAVEKVPDAKTPYDVLKVVALEAMEHLLLAGSAEYDMADLSLDNVDMWAQVLASDTASLPAQSFDDAMVAGSFYVVTPKGCAPIVFLDARKGSVFAKNSYEAHPRIGDLLTYPGWLEHEVPPSPTTSVDLPRISFEFVLNGNPETLADVSFSEDGTDEQQPSVEDVYGAGDGQMWDEDLEGEL